MKKSTRLAGTAVIFGIGLTVSSCGLGGPTSSAPSRSDTVVIGARVQAETLDPVQASNATNEFYNAPIYNTLVTYNAKSELVPELAESWELDPNATSLTLTLRQGASFHSGNAVTALDVVYSLDRVKKIGTGAAAFIPDYKSAVATGDLTVKIELAKVNVDFAKALSMIYIVDSKLVSQHEGSDNAQQWLANNDAGSGAYTMTAFKPGQQVSLKRFDGYFAKLDNRPAAIEMRMIMDAGAIRDELKSGGIDIGYEITPADMPQFSDKSKYQIVRLPSPIQTYVYMNTQGAVTADPRVREAVQLAYDYQGHLDTIMGGRAKFATGLAPDTVQCRIDFPAPRRDLQRAKQLIQEAGAAGKSLTLAYQTGPVEQNMAGTSLESSLREIGLSVEVKNITFPQYLQMLSNASTTPDLAIAWDYPAYPTIGPLLNRAWNSAYIGQTNFTRYQNPAVDELLNRARSSADAQSACADYQQAQRLIDADRTVVRIVNKVVEVVTNEKVTGLGPVPTSQVFDVSLIQRKK